MVHLKKLFFIIPVILCLLVGCSLQTALPEPRLPASSRLLDSSGRIITTVGNYNRSPVDMKEISPHMKQAVIAAEDARFYKHFGVDIIGLARALYHNLRAQKIVEGGSTITQQLAKNLYLSHERTITRKIKEMYYALLLERNYTKDEILNKYLNTVYFGQGCYGVEAAAQNFFDKHAEELTLAESAMLAGLIKAPSIYSNPDNLEQARQRQQYVLERMLEKKYINAAELEKAKKEEIKILPVSKPFVRAAYFVDEVIKQVKRVLPGEQQDLYTGGLQIYTTLNLEIQKAVENAVQRGLKNKDPQLQAALVAVNPHNGHVLAMVGGRNYSQSQYNRSLAKRQPGSAFKPIVYAAALERGYTAASTIFCGPVEYSKPGRRKPYKPTDYEGSYHYRHFTLKEALKISDNVVAVKLNVLVGPRSVVDLARRLGIKSRLNPAESLALGSSEVSPLELANAYGVFANEGILAEPIYFTKVVDRDGKVLVANHSKLSRVLDEKHAYIMTDMLRSVLEEGGTGSFLRVRTAAAGKTGTTDNFRDAWFVGYTPNLSAAVYVGYDKYEKKGSQQVVGSGSAVAGPIWQDFINNAVGEQEVIKEFKVPKGIIFKKICTRDGLLASPASTEVIKAAFVKGTEPAVYCIDDTDWSILSLE